MKFPHLSHGYDTKRGTVIPTKDYGVDASGCVRLIKPKAPSRCDKRRATGVLNRAFDLIRLGRLSRVQVEARANRLGYTLRPATD